MVNLLNQNFPCVIIANANIAGRWELGESLRHHAGLTSPPPILKLCMVLSLLLTHQNYEYHGSNETKNGTMINRKPAAIHKYNNEFQRVTQNSMYMTYYNNSPQAPFMPKYLYLTPTVTATMGIAGTAGNQQAKIICSYSDNKKCFRKTLHTF